jgi:hypothetical protein
LKLEIRGRYLSPNAAFQIDNEAISPTVTPEDPEARDNQTQASTLYKILRLEVTDALKEKAWQHGQHKLTLINPDGQQVSWPFTVEPAV